jgi:hypothetical protein
MLNTLFLLSLLLLAMPALTHAWSRPLWYQVGMDLQPWGCQPDRLEGCRGSLGCPGYWMGLGRNRIYPVAGVTITTTVMLVISRAMLQRYRSQDTKGEVSTTLSVPNSSCLYYAQWVHVLHPTLNHQPALWPCGLPALLHPPCNLLSSHLSTHLHGTHPSAHPILTPVPQPVLMGPMTT